MQRDLSGFPALLNSYKTHFPKSQSDYGTRTAVNVLKFLVFKLVNHVKKTHLDTKVHIIIEQQESQASLQDPFVSVLCLLVRQFC